MIRLELPTFVQRSDGAWTATPLLAAHAGLSGLGRNPATAIEALERAIRHRYREVEPEMDDELAALGWTPADLETRRVVALPAGNNQEIRLATLVGTFVLGGARHVVVPRLGRWFVVDDDPNTWEERLARAVRKWIDEGATAPDVDPRDLSADRVLSARVELRPSLVSPIEGAGGGGLFALLFGSRKVSGPAALDAISTDRAPEPALVEDARSQAIVAAITATPPIALAIVGPAGVGRKTLVLDAMARIAAEIQGEADDLRDRRLLSGRSLPGEPRTAPRLVHVDPQRIVTGMSQVGEWQRRLEAALDWVTRRRRQEEHQEGADVVLVDDPVALAQAGRSAGSDLVASVLFRPFVERAAFPMIVVATPEQWHRLVELDRPFAELFRVMRVDAPDPARTLAILTAHRARLERERSIEVANAALRRLIEIEGRHGGGGTPGALVSRLTRVVDVAQDVVDADDVEEVFFGDTGLRSEILSDDPLDDAALRRRLADGLVEQPAAVDALAAAVHVVKSGLRPRGRPIAVWLFVGPTGVGKTEAAKVLTKTLFQSEGSLVRFDLNAFADAGAVHRLLSGDGALTTAVRRRPFCVLLLDEVEKAHPAVHDLLLQVLDEGRLTDPDGRTTSFETTIVVMTSNVGAAEIGSGVGFSRDAEDRAVAYKSAVSRAFRPEFVNRIDRIVPFGVLSPAALRAVASLQLERLLARDGFRHRTALLDVAPEALEKVAIDAWDPRFGARGVKRAIERRLVAAAAETLAATRGEDPLRIGVSLAGSEVALTVEPLSRAAPRPPLAPLADPDVAISALEREVAALRPEGGLVARSPRLPGDPDHGEVLALVEEIRGLRARSHRESDDALDVAEPALVRALNQGRTVNERGLLGRRWGRVAREQRGRRALRGDLRHHVGGGQAAVVEEDLRLARLRLDAITGPDEAVARLVPRTGRGVEWPAFVASFWQAWGAVAGRVGGSLHGRGDERVARGSGFVELLRGEVGLHWWLAADAAPVVGAFELGDPEPSNEILRVYCPPSSRHDQGAVEDLRSGEIEPLSGLGDALVGWALRARGGA